MRDSGQNNLRLDYERFRILCRAQGGLTLHRLIHERSDLFTFGKTPDIVYIQVGGNDLASHLDAEHVATAVFSFANFLHHGLNIQFVIIGQLLRRRPDKVPINYNDKVFFTNMMLDKLCVDNDSQHIIFWKHRGFWSELNYLDEVDGVHLNMEGLRKYFRSVRSAVLHAGKLLGNIYVFR